MKYFIDTEFLEGSQTKRLLGFSVGKTKPTIDLISIGIVAQDDRKYYAVSNEFNLDEAWNRWAYNSKLVSAKNQEGKEYWIRDNVLGTIYVDLLQKSGIAGDERNYWNFTKSSLKKLISWHGKSNKQIAQEVRDFVMCYDPSVCLDQNLFPEFYGYYADYDWVVFCWLFGKMIDLPKRFPMYCKDVKQIFDETALMLPRINREFCSMYMRPGSFYCDRQEDLRKHLLYPQKQNNHHALDDAIWIKELYEFLMHITKNEPSAYLDSIIKKYHLKYISLKSQKNENI